MGLHVNDMIKNYFYVYMYLREDGTPYYVGKGIGNRAYQKNRRLKPPPKNRIIIHDRLTEEQAFQQEIEHIAFYGRKDNGTGMLRNLTDGGEGASGAIRSDESLLKQKETRQKKFKELRKAGKVTYVNLCTDPNCDCQKETPYFVEGKGYRYIDFDRPKPKNLIKVVRDSDGQTAYVPYDKLPKKIQKMYSKMFWL